MLSLVNFSTAPYALIPVMGCIHVKYFIGDMIIKLRDRGIADCQRAGFIAKRASTPVTSKMSDIPFLQTCRFCRLNPHQRIKVTSRRNGDAVHRVLCIAVSKELSAFRTLPVLDASLFSTCGAYSLVVFKLDKVWLCNRGIGVQSNGTSSVIDDVPHLPAMEMISVPGQGMRKLRPVLSITCPCCYDSL